MKNNVLLLLLISILLLSCKKEKEAKDITNDVVPNATDTISKGSFIGVDHSLSGEALLIKDTTDNYIVRLENFTLTAAPDADILLSKSSTYNATTVLKIYDLGVNTGYNKSNINIDVDNATVFTDYPYVLVWCETYSAFFGHAKLE